MHVTQCGLIQGLGRPLLGFLLASQCHRHPFSQPLPLSPNPCPPARSRLTLTKACLHLHLPWMPLGSCPVSSPWNPPWMMPSGPSFPRTLCHPSRLQQTDLATWRHRCPSSAISHSTCWWLLTAAPAQPPLGTLTHNSCSGPGGEMRVVGESEQTWFWLPPCPPLPAPPTHKISVATQ